MISVNDGATDIAISIPIHETTLPKPFKT